MQPSQINLPTAFVARYRAVDREIVGSALVDTPNHLYQLTADIDYQLTADIDGQGILTPLRLGFNEEFGILDGNHRVAAAIRLGLQSVPVTLVRVPLNPKPEHAQPMRLHDQLILWQAEAEQDLQDAVDRH